MAENISHPQYVGKAEAPKPAEFVLNPEQQQVVDVMNESGKKLQEQVAGARESAGKKLVAAGIKQYKVGLEETVKNEVGVGIQGALIGGAIGAITHGNENIFTSAGKGALGAGQLGAAFGFESVWQPYNKRAAVENLLPTGTLDWIMSMVAGWGIADIPNPNNKLLITGGKWVAATLLSTPAMGAIRNIGTGLSMMAMGK